MYTYLVFFHGCHSEGDLIDICISITHKGSFLSFSLITLNVSWILKPVSSSVSRQNGIHSRWPIGQLRNQKWSSAGEKKGGGILVHVFYDFPSSAAASASFISLPNLTISSTRIFPSVARKIQKIVHHTRS